MTVVIYSFIFQCSKHEPMCSKSKFAKMENMEKSSIIKTVIMTANQYIFNKNNSNMILFQHQLDVSWLIGDKCCKKKQKKPKKTCLHKCFLILKYLLQVLLGITSRGSDLKFFHPRNLLPTECLTVIIDIMRETSEIKPSLIIKCLQLLRNLGIIICQNQILLLIKTYFIT